MDTCPHQKSAEKNLAAEIYQRLRPRQKTTLHEKARSFLDLMDIEPEAPNVSPSRRAEVLRDIQRHRFYEHTPEELLWGCRFAWRHSVRCIGRGFWRNLEVRDARSTRSTDEMAAQCEGHVRAATNNGVVRPMVTVFEPLKGRREWRIRNYQLIRYAGYRTADGGVMGDPAEVSFTERCIALGWRAPENRGRFDVLPLVISGPGKKHDLFELPADSILEVPIFHPEFEWFKELDLRWYAVPFVSNMLLEIGGLKYTAAPFNGWYMGTEIGARNLADVDRYNLLPEVAMRMGIRSRSETSLWRDRALIELNRAVLFSYQRAGVRMVDHHTAAALHVRFEEEEKKAGRPVTGRWEWLVPPISGSSCPVWGRQYDATEYSPNFHMQPQSW